MKDKLLLLLSALLLSGALSHAAPLGTAFTYQGRLDQNGQPANGNYFGTFGLYDAATNGTLIGQTSNSVAVSGGFFTVNLDFGSGAYRGEARWLEVAVSTNGGQTHTTLLPRTRVAPVPNALYSTYASTAGTVTNGAIGLGQLGTVGAPPVAGQLLGYDGTALVWGNPAASSGAWVTGGNTIAAGNFLGTLNNLPLELKANNLRVLRLEPEATSPNLIGGWSGNNVTPNVFGATIGGGGAALQFGMSASNHISDHFGTISGGAHNLAGNAKGSVTDAYYATVGGGHFNSAKGVSATVGGGANNEATADNTTVGGGWQNTANGVAATVAGGSHNVSSGDYSAVGGGLENLLNETVFITGGGEFPRVTNIYPITFATIAGGVHNTNLTTGSTIGGGGLNLVSFSVSAPTLGYSSIAGGLDNRILQSDRGTIGGGSGNRIQGNPALGFAYRADVATVAGGQNNVASGAASSVGGGNGNTAANNDATVSGGLLNRADGFRATVPGGEQNRAGGARSFAAGYRAQANHDGSFVWSSYPADSSSFADSRFHVFGYNGFSVDYHDQIGSGGGARWVYIGPQIGGQTIATWTGAWLSDGGTWMNASDRHRKVNFRAVDTRAILKEVAALPLTTWSYTNEPTVRHLGPMAQDFRARFQLGSDDKSIATIDESGVALAAIQGLHEIVTEKEARIAALEDKVATLEKQDVAQRQTLARWEARFIALEQAAARTSNTHPPGVSIASRIESAGK